MSVWMRVKEAAIYANVGERTFRTWLSEKGLKHSRPGGLILIKPSDIDAFIEASAREQNSESEVDRAVDEVMTGLKG